MPELKLAQEPDFLKMALDEAQSLIFVKDKNFRIIYANKPFLSLYPPEKRGDIIGTTTFEEFPPEEVEGFVKEDRIALEGGETQIIENVTDYQGNERTVLTRKIGFVAKNGTPLMLGVCHDVKELVDKQKKLAEVNVTLEKFVTVAAHDLRSPLNTLVSYMDIIKLDKGNVFSKESSAMLDDMKKSAVKLMDQVVSLIDLYKQEPSVKSKECNLNEVMAQALYNLSALTNQENAKILTDNLPTVKGEPNLYRQLFQNIIENSLKYKSDKSPLIMIKGFEQGDDYLFEFEDNGMGVSSARDPFANNESGEMPQRSGIGLSLCKQIVSNYNGKIWIDHSVSEGCKVCVAFPKEQIGLHQS